MFSLTVIVAVAAVAWTVSLRTRQAFEKADQAQTLALVEQFRREFQRRADDVALRLDRMAGNDRVSRIAFDLGHNGDPALYLTEAAALAQEYELDYLEIVASDGSIVSSAQWPARFGYKETVLPGCESAAIPQERRAAERGCRNWSVCRANGSWGRLVDLPGGRQETRSRVPLELARSRWHADSALPQSRTCLRSA